MKKLLVFILFLLSFNACFAGQTITGDLTVKGRITGTNISGINTGDETATSIKSKLGINTLSGSNTGDQDLSGKVDKITGKGLSTNDLTNELKANYDNAYLLSHSNEVVLASNYGTANNSDRLNAAVSAIGTANKVLYISGGYTIDANVSIPANISLYFAEDCFITVNDTKSLDIYGKIVYAPNHQIFSFNVWSYKNVPLTATDGTNTTFTATADFVNYPKLGQTYGCGFYFGHNRSYNENYNGNNTIVADSNDSHLVSGSINSNTGLISVTFDSSTYTYASGYYIKQGVFFPNGAEVLPEWFGAIANDINIDCALALGMAGQSLIGTHGNIKFTQNNYYFKSPTLWTNSSNIELTSNCQSNIIKNQTVAGATNNVSNFVLLNGTAAQTDNGKLYWEHIYNSGVRTVNIYKNTDGASGNKVSTGTSVLTNVRADKAFTVSSITTNQLQLTNHLFPTIQKLRVYSTGVLPAPLLANTDYYTKKIDANKFTLYSTYKDAYNGTNIIDITDNGTGTHYLSLTSENGTSTVYTESTTNVKAYDVIVLGKGTPREETVQVASVTSGFSFALTSSLLYDHTAANNDSIETVSLALSAVNGSNINGYVTLVNGGNTTDQNLSTNIIKPCYSSYWLSIRSGSGGIRVTNLNFKGYATNAVNSGLQVGDSFLQISSENHVYVGNCKFFDTGDDALRITTNSAYEYTNEENVIVDNCYFYNTGQVTMTSSGTYSGAAQRYKMSGVTLENGKAGIKFASKQSADNFIIERCQIIGSRSSALTFESVGNVIISNVTITGCRDPLSILNNNSSSVDGYKWGNYKLSNIIVKDCKRGLSLQNTAFFKAPNPRYVLDNLELNNVTFDCLYGTSDYDGAIYMDLGAYNNLKFNNITLNKIASHKPIYFNGGGFSSVSADDNFVFNDVTFTGCAGRLIDFERRDYNPNYLGDRNLKNITISNCSANSGDYLIYLDGVDSVSIKSNTYNGSGHLLYQSANCNNITSFGNVENNAQLTFIPTQYTDAMAVSANTSAISSAVSNRLTTSNIKAGNNVSVSVSGNDVTINSTGGGSGAVNSVNGYTGTVVLTTADIIDGTDKRYITDAQRTVLSNTSGTNTGDQDLSGLVPKTTTINGHALNSNVTVTKADVGLGSVSNVQQSIILFAQAGSSSTANATTFYAGNTQRGFSGQAGNSKIYIPQSGTITSVYGNFCNTGAFGSAETSSIYIRVNNTTDYLISNTIANNAAANYFSNTSLNIPVNAGDYFEVKWTTPPTWTTKPAGVTLGMNIGMVF